MRSTPIPEPQATPAAHPSTVTTSTNPAPAPDADYASATSADVEATAATSCNSRLEQAEIEATTTADSTTIASKTPLDSSGESSAKIYPFGPYMRELPHHDHYHENTPSLYADTLVRAGAENEELALKAKLLATLGWRLASCGAETRLIVQSVKKMAHDLGCHSVDLGISRDGIIVKLRKGHQVSVEFMEVKHFAINMDSVARLHEICLQVSEGKLTDLNKIFLAIRAVRPRHYRHQYLIVIEALAAAAFAYLNGGDLGVCLSAIMGGLVLMFCRFLFIKRGFFESFTFMLSACIGSFVSSLTAHYIFACTPEHVTLAATATTLLLVPGFPLLNGFLDIFKGYVPIGLIRLVIATVLVISAALGLLTTTFLTNFLFAQL